MIEHITHDTTVLAIIIRSNYSNDNISFFTPKDFSQQLGYMNRPKGYLIDPHLHNSLSRVVEYTNEVLFIKSGKLRVDFYSEKTVYLKSSLLKKGDVILLASGGHGFEMLEQTEVIEVKQGPYAGDADKTRFNPVSKEDIKF